MFFRISMFLSPKNQLNKRWTNAPHWMLWTRKDFSHSKVNTNEKVKISSNVSFATQNIEKIRKNISVANKVS